MLPTVSTGSGSDRVVAQPSVCGFSIAITEAFSGGTGDEGVQDLWHRLQSVISASITD